MNQPCFVFARTDVQYRNFIIQFGFDSRNYVRIQDAEKLRGVDCPHVIFLDGTETLPKFEEIKEMIKLRRSKIATFVKTYKL